MPRPASGKQIRVSNETKEKIRALYLQGVHYKEILKRHSCGLTNFWLIVKDLRQTVRKEAFEVDLKALSSLPDAKLGWIAGIIDGEGYIGIVETPGGLTPRVDVSSTTRCMQDELRRLTEVGHVGKKKPTNKRCRATFGWSLWAAKTVRPFLEAIEPHLVVKKKMSEIVRKFCERRSEAIGKPYTRTDYNALAMIRKLNKKGPSAKS